MDLDCHGENLLEYASPCYYLLRLKYNSKHYVLCLLSMLEFIESIIWAGAKFEMYILTIKNDP